MDDLKYALATISEAWQTVGMAGGCVGRRGGSLKEEHRVGKSIRETRALHNDT